MCTRMGIYPRAHMYADCREMRRYRLLTMSRAFFQVNACGLQIRRLSVSIIIIIHRFNHRHLFRDILYILSDTIETRIYRMLFDQTSDRLNSTSKTCDSLDGRFLVKMTARIIVGCFSYCPNGRISG